MTIFAKLKIKKMKCGNQLSESFPLSRKTTRCLLSLPAPTIGGPWMTLPFGALNDALDNFKALVRSDLNASLLVDLCELPILTRIPKYDTILKQCLD